LSTQVIPHLLIEERGPYFHFLSPFHPFTLPTSLLLLIAALASITCFVVNINNKIEQTTGSIRIFVGKMWVELIFALLFTISCRVAEVKAQEPVSQDEILGEELSPPLSEEDGLTILGTGPLDIATTLNCHRRLYSYRVRNLIFPSKSVFLDKIQSFKHLYHVAPFHTPYI